MFKRQFEKIRWRSRICCNPDRRDADYFAARAGTVQPSELRSGQGAARSRYRPGSSNRSTGAAEPGGIWELVGECRGGLQWVPQWRAPPNFNYAQGGNPYFHQPTTVDPTVYLSGGQDAVKLQLTRISIRSARTLFPAT